MKDIYIFDLDGTLALNQHRQHLIQKEGKQDWDAFSQACIHDMPNEPVLEILCALKRFNPNCEIWIVSGRCDSVKEQTIEWLKNNGSGGWPVSYDNLIMREYKDNTPDHELKRSWLYDGTIPKERIIAVFDDRQKVVDMWRAEGLTCLQVAPGDF